ncbi:sugar phosphate isomerase/epimerase family protein [Poritiphilus flavus]|uniref:TIM barrel protein n=1 Tax=Poritiphilus flavus TaxID=2697053 RepID=A0A6L9E8W1_9FLAO|nr:sugar phosphate isomerase/epimerase [Poritiphilus flavus]NAS11031.1 TIM barrel protein [Poritiphilus flavus]
MKGPGIFLAQFVGDDAPFNSLVSMAKWASDLGYKGVQVPSWDPRLFNLDLAAESKAYCDEIKGSLRDEGLELIELASYLQGQVLAMHPAYQKLFQGFYPKGLKGQECVRWATAELQKTIRASAHLGTTNISVMSGGLAWPYIYPWPQRSPGLIEDAFDELVARWLPLLNQASEAGITFGYELHPGSDLFDGATYQKFLDKTDEHPAACLTYDASHFLLQQLDYLDFIKIFKDRIKAFHVKDAEFVPDGMTGVYGGYLDWKQRAGRFRSLGDGEINYSRIFSMLTAAGYEGWAIMEWECCIKSPEQGATEGAEFISRHMIELTDRAFDDFAGSETDSQLNNELLGLSEEP